MDRHTESFICLSLFVILLQNTARSQDTECSHSYRDAPGFISDLFTTNHPTYTCRYHVYAPVGHYIKLNITGLLGHPMVEECLPRLVIKNIGKLGMMTNLQRLCNQGEPPLPLVVQSTDSELKIVFRGHDRQISSFNATFTFHRNTAATGPSAECLACARATKQQTTHLAAASNASVMSTTSVVHDNRHRTEPPKPDLPVNVERHMELFVLIILAPVTLVCICCVIMYYRRKVTTHQQNPRLPSETSSPPASHAPLLSPHSHNFSSSVHHQETLRQQRETICRRSESTEKFPSSVVLRDEEESSSMRSNVVLHRDFRENGIRPPPNRNVSEIYENRLSSSSQQQHSPRASPQMSVPRNQLLRTDSARSGALVDSVTKSPLQFGDSDSEAPPPYNCVTTTSIPSNNTVCDPQHFVSNSAAAASAGHQVRHHGRGAHPQHANGRHPPVQLSPHFELDADQGEQQQQQQQQQNMAIGTILDNRLSLDTRQHERSDHETTEVL